MFGNVNSETIKHLEFALQSLQGERGHRLEAIHDNSNLKSAEDHVRKALTLVRVYLDKDQTQ